MKKKKKKVSIFVTLLIVVACLTIGYALLSTTLNILGNTTVSGNTWDIHWENVQVTEGSTTDNTQEATITSPTQVQFSISLDKPGDFYEFTVDAVNEGTIDGMIDVISTNVYQSNGTTPATLPSAITYSLTYDDDVPIERYQLLSANSSETYKVRVEYKRDIENSELLTSAATYVFKVGLSYVQADDNAIEKPTRFQHDSWDEIISNGPSKYNLGDTKEVDFGEYGIHTLRIANISDPSECNNIDFSETACGFVIEFADIITKQRINPHGGSGNGYGNRGSWEYTEIRSFLNGDFYNSIPEDLKSIIIETRVITGHGSADSTNNETVDFLYLLSPHEVWEDDDNDINDGIDCNDTAYNNTRQLDYYANNNVTTSNYEKCKKSYNNQSNPWWLRTPIKTIAINFYAVSKNGGIYTSGTQVQTSAHSRGVSPAFRIGLVSHC